MLFREQSVQNTSSNQPQELAICDREISYQRERTKNRVFSQLVEFFASEAVTYGVSKRSIAEQLKKDPAQISRWLAQPSNLTLETLSDLLLSLGAEVDCRIVKFSEKPRSNYAHPWATDYGDFSSPPIEAKSVTKVSVSYAAKKGTGTVSGRPGKSLSFMVVQQ